MYTLHPIHYENGKLLGSVHQSLELRKYALLIIVTTEFNSLIDRLFGMVTHEML